MVKKFALQIVKEVEKVFSEMNANEVEQFVDHILNAEKVFIMGVGRVFLSLKFLGKRLIHLGINTQIVGSVTEEPISSKDILIVGSGSGESKVPITIAKIAKEKGAKIGLITSSPTSTLKKLSDFTITLSCPTKLDSRRGIKSIQPMTNLFDQTLHLLGDAITIRIIEVKKIDMNELWKYHSNLE